MSPNSLLAAALALILSALPAGAAEVLVFAAASTATALDEAGALFAARGGDRVKAAYAASSTLAKQIELGAPAQIYLSADQRWMDYLAARKLLVADSRRDLLGNRLVVVTPADRPSVPLKLDGLAATLGGGRLALGDPDHVPAGLYARQALEKLGQWAAVEPRLARAESVRAALALVEHGEAPLGIVYATDAAESRKVRVAAEIPESLHEPILYPVALVAGGDTPAARAFLGFLQSPEARAVFARHGFRTR